MIKESKMSLYSMELDAVTSFLGEEPSLWATERDDLFKVQGTELGSSASLADELLGELDGQCIKESSPFEDLPEWMSEKIALAEWIDAADIMPPDLLTTVPLEESIEPAEELLQLLMVNEEIPPQPPSPGEETASDLLALYPAASLCSPDSPLSLTSEDSSVFQNSEGSSLPSSPFDSKPQSPEAQLTAEECLWQIADGLTSIFSNEILNDTNTDVVSQPAPKAPKAGSSPAFSQSGEEDEELLEVETPQRKSKAKPKLKTVKDPGIKKTKKRDQNKVAATRYREKKRVEANVLMTEQMELEEKNSELNDKVESLSREIKYLKDLMVEVYKVKGELKILRK
ncbi:cyclic AMP-dependent transcription factor ATF-4-like [Asterias amurensis]|uniref:cyclic AMP-dependent transcription factor ATF-4-like n=1 Tax=Asterias amurensis TaxID=7602 RepID=UPI003AB45F41